MSNYTISSPFYCYVLVPLTYTEFVMPINPKSTGVREVC